MAIVEYADLPAAVQTAELVDTMLDGANAFALRVAPCLDPVTAEPDQLAEAKLILIGVIRRWVEAGAGSFQQQTAGPFSVSTDTRQRTGFTLWPSEIEHLQDICKQENSGAFSVDTAPSLGDHSPICALYFGAAYCSCGYDIAGVALYEDVEP